MLNEPFEEQWQIHMPLALPFKGSAFCPHSASYLFRRALTMYNHYVPLIL